MENKWSEFHFRRTFFRYSPGQDFEAAAESGCIKHEQYHTSLSLSLSPPYISTFEVIPAKVLLILYVALISSQVHALWLESAESGVCTFFLLLSFFLYGFTKIESCYNSTTSTDTVQFGTESFFIVLSKFTSSYKWVSFIMADINTEWTNSCFSLMSRSKKKSLSVDAVSGLAACPPKSLRRNPGSKMFSVFCWVAATFHALEVRF